MTTKHSQHIYMPNEIFDDLKGGVQKSQHVAFSYAYYYFISHLYRYCEYEGVTQPLIKEKLRYNANDKRLDYLIKKDGVLDTIGYTQTTTNYPIGWSMDEDNMIEFKTIQDFKRENESISIISDRNFKVKFPIKMFYRDEDAKAERWLNGTLYDVSSTHKIDFDIFEKCMSQDRLGTMAFYIYGWIRNKNYIYGDYGIPSRKLAQELGISEPTLFKYIKEMESKEDRILKVTHQKFIGVGGEANLYRAL